MRVTGIAMAATVTLLTVGCGYGIKAATDYDRTVQFATYQNYSVLNGSPSGNPLLDQRVAADVKAALASKGWTEVPQGEGHAAVVVHIATKTKHTHQAFYEGWGGGWRWGWRGGPGGSTTYVRDYKVGTIVVDIFDADTRQAIWRGSSTDALSDNPSTNARATHEAIAKMFSHFPPASRASL